MAFGSKKTGCLVIVLALAWPAAALDFPARHRHWRGGCAGVLTLDADGAGFRQAPAKKKAHAWRWKWEDIQQLELGDDRRVRILSYKDRALALGRDQAYEFVLQGSPDLAAAREWLGRLMDGRFIARLAAPGERLLWELPVKRIRRNAGPQGVLRVYEDRVVFAAGKAGESRTWRDSDIDMISSAGPFELSIVTFERGGRFDFQTRQRLDAARYEALWLRLESLRGLRLLQESNQEKETAQ